MSNPARETKELDELYADFAEAGLIPLWTQREDLMPASPRSAAVPHLWRWTELLPIAERAGRAGPGGTRRRAAGHGAVQSRAARPAVRHAHVVGRRPVPRSRGDRAVAPAQPGRLPLRHRGRGGVDHRGRGPDGDASRRPAADAQLGLPRAPQRHRRPDGLARRARHPAGRPAGRRLLRVRTGRAVHPRDAAVLPRRAAVGAPRTASARRARTGPTRRWARTGGSTRTPR